MTWLLAEETARAMQRAERTGVGPSAEHQREFQQRVEVSDGLPRNMRVTGNSAEIRVEGVLTKRPSLWAMLFGGGNTSYEEIISALSLAQNDPDIKGVTLFIDSPGGHVDGLFETLAAIESFKKPISVRAANAQSAAYSIAASAGPIEATTPASNFGSVGTAVDFVRWDDMEIISITNSGSPDKRPDPKTEEGRAVIVKYLDAVEDLFVGAIAKGRGVDKDDVTTKFGRGATLLAGEAKRRGMIDTIAKPALRVVGASAAASEEEITAMDIKTLRAQHPELAEQLEACGATSERDRVIAHLTMGEKSGALDVAIKAIRAGDGMTLTLQAEYMTAAINQRDVKNRQAESDEAGRVVNGAHATQDTQDVGDAAAAIMAARRGKKLVAHA